MTSALFKGLSFHVLQAILIPSLFRIVDSREKKIESSPLFGDNTEAVSTTGPEQKAWKGFHYRPLDSESPSGGDRRLCPDGRGGDVCAEPAQPLGWGREAPR